MIEERWIDKWRVIVLIFIGLVKSKTPTAKKAGAWNESFSFKQFSYSHFSHSFFSLQVPSKKLWLYLPHVLLFYMKFYLTKVVVVLHLIKPHVVSLVLPFRLLNTSPEVHFIKDLNLMSVFYLHLKTLFWWNQMMLKMVKFVLCLTSYGVESVSYTMKSAVDDGSPLFNSAFVITRIYPMKRCEIVVKKPWCALKKIFSRMKRRLTI